MREIWIERENRATRDEPYVDGDRKNLCARAHCHEEIEVVLVRSGAVDATVDGTAVTVRSGEILIVLPGEVHHYVSREPSRSHVMKLYAPPDFLTLRVGDARRILQGYPHYEAFRSAVETIVSEHEARNAGYKYAIASESSRMLLLVVRCLCPVRVSEREQKEIHAHVDFLTRFEGYLETHYSEPITLDGAASYMHYSRYYFAHRFSEITGTTFLDYVTQFRLERARIDLKNGKNVLETALACGFGSVRSFHRAFKKHYGVSPVTQKAAKSSAD